ncbi:hypothetical protein [Gluconobacter cerinus]|uniref:hypothetical protein n=1 Tax=Gluconobacter cerinus TaxID=38307 RepID=UPI001B8CA5A7|nr:hypothetical protein [Gluconobacter cerinus]MBS1038111.1 hypothetical protein [Gluconobacter cerinus]
MNLDSIMNMGLNNSTGNILNVLWQVYHSTIISVLLCLALFFVVNFACKKIMKKSVFHYFGRSIEPIFAVSEIIFPADKFIPVGNTEEIDKWLVSKTNKSPNKLIQGDRLGWLKDKIPENGQYGYIYKTIPSHLRRHIVLDGRLPGGWDVNWLAWRHVHAEVIGAISAKAVQIARLKARNTFIITGLLGAVLSVLLHQSAIPFPSWADGVSALPSSEYYTLNGFTIAVSVAISVALAFIGSSLLIPVYAYFGFWRVFNIWWNQQNKNLKIPTRDAIVLWKSNMNQRKNYLTAYNRSVAMLPKIPENI